MDEFSVGGKITLENDVVFRIIDIVKIEGRIYYFCYDESEVTVPKVVERIDVDNEVFLRIIQNAEIMKRVAEEVLKDGEKSE